MIIYVEKEAFGYPLTQKIIDKFNAHVIEIRHYKDIFNRYNQDFNAQKEANRLILAVKKENFIYDGSKFFHYFGYEKFHYASQLLGCVYNCEYCYLSGMYPSGYTVIFVNEEDVIREAKKLEGYLAISYDTDLLAIENITGFHTKWLELACKKPELVIESRTKSKNVSPLPNNPPENFILSFSLSPSEVVPFEKKTPNLKARLDAINLAIEKGYKVRLVIDPILAIENFEAIYDQFLSTLNESVDLAYVIDVAIGAFRVSKDYFKRMKKVHKSEILYHPFETKNNEVRYKDEEARVRFVREKLWEYMPKERVVG